MIDYISRQATIDVLCDNCDTVQAVCSHYPCKRYLAIESLPTADVAPVRHGRWKRVGDTAWECSACGCISCCNGTYCPDCGASMMEGAEE